ncbi:MAG: S-adenosylmethionine:tRNA ribosyltransferase-isomerase [Niabella sp.]
MMHPQKISISDYAYPLPEESIAKYPLENRDDSKLLVYKNGHLSEDVYKNIANLIPEQSLIVFNNTKVVEARLLFQKETGGVIEIFCLEPHEQYADITTAMNQTGNVLWLCLVGGASKWKNGLVLQKTILLGEKKLMLNARFVERRAGCFVIAFDWDDNQINFAEVLHEAGSVPLPPYIKRGVEQADVERYQTVYASLDGSVAAPTAGLHFTGYVFEQLKKNNIEARFVTLHVGAGTFKPVKAATMQEHEMHAEYIEVPKSFIENLTIGVHRAVVAVGTTSLRTIESLYWFGAMLLHNKNVFDGEMPYLKQWVPYEMEQFHYTVADALQALLAFLQNGEMFVAKTQIIIAPGYKFKIADGLITNFHQPSSTLLLLVAAFIGDDWRKAYNYALQNNFRFLSYGDGNLFWRNDVRC